MSDKRRHQTATERDMQGMAARKDRDSRPMRAIPEEVEDDITGHYEGEELREMRSRRPTGKRLELLEDKHDELVANVTEWRVEMAGEMGGVKAAVGELAGEVRGLATVIKDAAQRSHITFTASVDVEKAQALDTIDASKSKRDLRAKVLGGVLGGGALLEILHQLGVL